LLGRGWERGGCNANINDIQEKMFFFISFYSMGDNLQAVFWLFFNTEQLCTGAGGRGRGGGEEGVGGRERMVITNIYFL
jgi:hypothetical protein